jgi:hypothetical protein
LYKLWLSLIIFKREEENMENRPIGRWGRLHQDYLRDTEPGRYRCIFLSNGIWDYLDAIDEEAQREYDEKVSEIRIQMGVREKAADGEQESWQEQMRIVRMLAEECVLRDIVYK